MALAAGTLDAPVCGVLPTGVNFQELARCTEDFNGAQLKAVCALALDSCCGPVADACTSCCRQVCVEAGMIALRREGTIIQHEDFMEGIAAVQLKKKESLQYYA